MSLEEHFDPVFTTRLALREKAIQQNYRPIIGVHKWFARRPGTVFRSLLLAEFNGTEPLDSSYWRSHQLHGVIADPFMGGGTPIFEANRLGFSVVGADTNPMAYWVVRQSLAQLDLHTFARAAESVAVDVDLEVGELYKTKCVKCDRDAPVKYFLWVKTEECPNCRTSNDLFPGHLLAEAERHPLHVLVCAHCGTLNEYERQPTLEDPQLCIACNQLVHVEGSARRQRISCGKCGTAYQYPAKSPKGPPIHRMWAIEYHCVACKPGHTGRFFKRPDDEDYARFYQAQTLLAERTDLPIPGDEIPGGDETDRLHRWGYRRYREMFTERQLLGLGLLLRRICSVEAKDVRHALLTVFSDFLRYQNMLCRYDTYALKCQDIFSVHGFPVGLIQCENNMLGIPKVGSGSFRHFVEKYLRAKEYCSSPFETLQTRNSKKVVFIEGERIYAETVEHFPDPQLRQASICAAPATSVCLLPNSLDGVFTDPPYFANVQYAELMDFCFVWLRQALSAEFAEFRRPTTRSADELTGNVTLGRGIEEFTQGLSAVFKRYADALKPGAPFVFTYHHNDSASYVAVVVAVLDAGMDCTATLPAAAEMSASLHIAGTGSSILDSVFVCRRDVARVAEPANIGCSLGRDVQMMRDAGVRISQGDVRCLAAGVVARLAINRLRAHWDPAAPLVDRIALAGQTLTSLADELGLKTLISSILESVRQVPDARRATSAQGV